jgi:aminoglycoside phosphotransferase family enzyme/predicted kinase
MTVSAWTEPGPSGDGPSTAGAGPFGDGPFGGGPPPGEPYAEVLESHLSVVLLIGGRALKWKKPLRLPFVDLSTPGARLAVCRAELALNRRLAPDVYLDVARLDAPELPELSGEPVLVMRRMPRSRRLAVLLDGAQDLRPALTDIARQVARLHAGEPPVTDADLAASTERLWKAGYEQLQPYAGPVLPADQLEELHRLSGQYLVGRVGLLQARERSGLVRDGHGDLLAEDVFCLPDGVRILDCLEFDRSLRVNDVLADVAFLAMDLEVRGRGELARYLVDRYREHTDEHHPRSLEHHYVAYRAFVRAKIECLRAGQGDPAARDRARTLLALAVRRSRAARVHLVAVGGLPGSGKSTLSAELVDQEDDRDWVLLSSDAVRRDLFGVGAGRGGARAGGAASAGPQAFEQGHYDADHSAATYAELLRRGRLALAAGVCVVLDASWSRPADRDAAAALAQECSARFTAVQCVAALPTCARRLVTRPDPRGSDADPAVLAGLAERSVPWPQAQPIRTDGPGSQLERIAASVAAVRALLDAVPALP